ncbi:MAG: hypothetical protein IJP70_00925 [Bacteroidales bacterium]|nr:hypothetical protein [Bacteroidales bacterium]
MKRIFLPTLAAGMLFAGCVSNTDGPNDWLRLGLKGNVASITDTFYEAELADNGNVVLGNLIQGEKENRQVLPIRKIDFNEDGFWTNVANIDSSGVEQKRFEYTYDGTKLIEEKGFQNGAMFFHNTYRFEEDRKIYAEYDNIEFGKRWAYEDQYVGEKRTYRYRTNPDGNMDKLSFVYLEDGTYKIVPENEAASKEPIFYYDSEDKVVRIEFPKETRTYFYDTKGRLLKSYKNDELEMEYIYDTDDQLVQLYGFHLYPYMKISHRTYHYTYSDFDKQGNWRKCYEYFNDERTPRMIQIREISYY